VVMKSRKLCSLLLLSLSALVLLAVGGCGGGGHTNVVTVSVSPSVFSIIVSQSQTFTATVSGSTNLNVTWMCQYTTKSVDSLGKSTTSSKNACTSDTGNIPASSSNTTVIFTAPNKVPDPTKLAGSNCTSSSQNCSLTITLTATSAADPKKTGTTNIFLDSGISVTLNPPTATVPTSGSSTSQSQVQFFANLTNDLQTQGVTWLVTQGTPTQALPYPSLPTCSTLSPSCGSIDQTGLYSAPTAVPTTATLTVVATSKADTTRFAIATVAIIKGGPITFNGISPTIVPQGGTSYDIYLDAPFISSLSTVKVTGTKSGLLPISASQLKVLFPIPTTSVTSPPSTGARLRLTADNIHAADTFTVTVSDTSQTVTTCTGTPLPAGCSVQGNFTFDVIPVRPTSVASLPDSLVQNATTNDLPITIDGGYFGSKGDLAVATFDGNTLSHNPSASRQLNLSLSSTTVNSLPGLYPLSVASTTVPAPVPNNPSVTNLAVFPDYSTTPPSVVGAGVPAGTKPSAVDIDTRLGILAVAETGSNLVQFFSIGTGTLAPLPCPVTSCAVTAPTNLSINQSNHTVAVVSPQDQNVVVLPLTATAGVPGVTYPLTIALAGLIPPIPDPSDNTKTLPPPLPYSIGLDSDTNNALVAYSSSSNPTAAKVGFLLDLNKDSQTCLAGAAQTTAPCVFAQVTLNTGTYPHIAMAPHSHLAYVTPGGVGSINGIDVTKPSSQLTIKSVSVTSGLATVTVDLASGQTLGLNPGNPGTVLIENVPAGANGTNFNGAFTVQGILNTNTFSYALNAKSNDTAACPASPAPCGQVYFSGPNVVVGISQTAQGIAINPITRTAAMADANATGNNAPQIDFLNSLDQSVTSIIFHAGCTFYSTTCSGAPELLGTSSVAFQPYTNSLVSYNPQQNQLSVSNPVTQRRYAIVCVVTGNSCPVPPALPADQTSTIGIPVSAPTTTLTLFGGIAADPATNQAFVVQSASGAIQIVNLGSVKAVQITELQVPTVTGAEIGGIAGAIMPQGTLTSGSDLAGVQIYGSGFTSSSQVHLDGTALPSGNVQFVSSRNLTVTIPSSFLSAPHRYAVDVVSGGVQSNASDFFVILAVDMKTACTGGNPQPNSVAIADQLPGQNFAPVAVVSNSGCNNISKIDIAPQLPVYDPTTKLLTGFAPNPNFGTILGSIATGTSPAGVAVSPRYGLAVVANTSDGTASVLDLTTGTQKVAAVATGTTPTGVAIDDGTGTALITNTGSNTVSELNLSLLFGSSPATTLSPSTIAIDTSPIGVAIDPDRGTSNRGLAVVTAVQLVGGSAPIGVLDSIDLGGTTPAKSTTATVGSVTATPTGVVFNPTVSPTLFYATSSGGNVVSTFNPDNGSTTAVHVGINPTSLAINPQTGGIVTVNSSSQTISVIDSISNPFKTRSSFGLSGSLQFGVAIDQFTNLAIIADQAHNRVLIFPVPN
jgi:DNA-binding beta-propeller fold protein YncE